MGGTGATAYWICQEAIRNQRRMEAQMRQTRDVRRASRLLSRVDRSESRHTFACAHACTSCGWLETPRAGGDPMRRDATAQVPPSCPRCGDAGWADLADVEVSQAFARAEQIELSLRGGITSTVLQGCATLAIGGVTFMAALAEVPGVFLFTTGAVATATLFAIGRKLAVGLSTPRRTAWRWHAPVRRFRAGKKTARGTLDGVGQVCSPLTGRMGLAYRIEVRYRGDRGDAFALVEQDATALRVDGEPLPHQPSIAIDGEEVDVGSQMSRDYLVSRGVDPYEPLVVREVVIAAGACVTLRHDALGGPTVVCSA